MPRTSHWLLRGLRHVDGILLTLVVLVLGISLAVVTSASGQSPVRISGHLVNMGLALALMVLIANVPPHLLSKVGPPLYATGVILLVGVALFGEIRNGARRWLDLGFIAFQPSELLKLALPLMLRSGVNFWIALALSIGLTAVLYLATAAALRRFGYVL